MTERWRAVCAGHPKVQETWSRVMGYVQQTDIHSPTVTVAESLMFSARLRLPRSTTDAAVGPAPASASHVLQSSFSVHIP